MARMCVWWVRELGPACQVSGNEKHVSPGLPEVPSSGWKRGRWAEGLKDLSYKVFASF